MCAEDVIILLYILPDGKSITRDSGPIASVGAWSREGKALVQLCQRSQCYPLDHHALLSSMNAAESWVRVGVVAALPPTPAHPEPAFPYCYNSGWLK